MANRGFVYLFGSLLAPVALYLGVSMTMDHFDRQGIRFFDTGKSILTDLESLAKAVKAKDAAAVENSYARDFHGTTLGLTRLEAAEEKDGAKKYCFRSDGGPQGRDAA